KGVGREAEFAPTPSNLDEPPRPVEPNRRKERPSVPAIWALRGRAEAPASSLTRTVAIPSVHLVALQRHSFDGNARCAGTKDSVGLSPDVGGLQPRGGNGLGSLLSGCLQLGVSLCGWQVGESVEFLLQFH